MKHMEPTIKQLILKRYRSIPAECITFDNPTIFVGRNGSGKSNLVSVFSFLAEAMAAPLQAVFDRAGGISAVRNRPSGSSHPPNFGLRVDLGLMNGKSKGGPGSSSPPFSRETPRVCALIVMCGGHEPRRSGKNRRPGPTDLAHRPDMLDSFR